MVIEIGKGKKLMKNKMIEVGLKKKEKGKKKVIKVEKDDLEENRRNEDKG